MTNNYEYAFLVLPAARYAFSTHPRRNVVFFLIFIWKFKNSLYLCIRNKQQTHKAMKTRKYTSNYETFYEVSFLSGENDNILDEKPTTHTARVFSDGVWYYCIRIDGKMANSLAYRSVKSAVKNAWIIK